MTIICYRDGILAADSAIWQGDVIVGHKEKIRRLQDGRLFAAAGASPLIQAVGDWLEGSAPAPRIPEGEDWDIFGIILGETGPMLIDRALNAYPVPGDYAAIGRGESFAMGALACGAGAEEAVKLCIKNLAFCAGTVQRELLVPQIQEDGLPPKQWTRKVLEAVLVLAERGEDEETLRLCKVTDSYTQSGQVRADLWLGPREIRYDADKFIQEHAGSIATLLRQALPKGKKFASSFLELPKTLTSCDFIQTHMISGRIHVMWWHVGKDLSAALQDRSIYDVPCDENISGPAGIRLRIDIPITDL